MSVLIGDIYDAALNPALWVDVLGKTRAFIGGCAIALSWKDAVAKRGGSYFDEGNLVPPYRQLYFDRYVKLDPCTTGQFFAEIGEPIATADLIPYEEFVQTRFYKEWVQPQGLVDAAMAALDKSVTNFSFLALFRHQRDGLFDDEARRRMRLVVPHFRRAVLIGKVIDLKRAEAASLADTLDGISAGMFLVNETGRITKLAHTQTSDHCRGSDFPEGGSQWCEIADRLRTCTSSRQFPVRKGRTLVGCWRQKQTSHGQFCMSRNGPEGDQAADYRIARRR